MYRIDKYGQRTTFTEEQDLFLEQNYLKIPIKEISRLIGKSEFGTFNRLKKLRLSVPKEIAEARKKASHYSKGSVPKNKGKKQSEYMSAEAIERTKETRFKKGDEPYNTKYDGYETITKEGYVYVRVKKGEFRLKHIVEWEKVNSSVPKGFCLSCVDLNKSNTDPSNWSLISREENMLRNSKYSYPEEIIPTMALISQINKQIKK